MVREAVQGWCDALLLISKTDMQGGDAKKVASQVLLDAAYNYQDGCSSSPSRPARRRSV
jgi:hypothetical protein